uniref:troponin I, fast skeletal muscle-like n=1 Tax=Myxine glutinosa TaxID=7769 RepID=UPI00358DFF25
MHLKSMILQKAKEELDQETRQKQEDKQNALSERVPPLELSGMSMQDLQEKCKHLYHNIDVADEERYDTNMKVHKQTLEIENLNQKIFDLKGKFKRPPLKRVRMSADAMLRALLGSKHKVSMDLRANLKSVKKEDPEKKDEIGDWRKNVEALSGMEGRKKLFNAGA